MYLDAILNKDPTATATQPANVSPTSIDFMTQQHEQQFGFANTSAASSSPATPPTPNNGLFSGSNTSSPTSSSSSSPGDTAANATTTIPTTTSAPVQAKKINKPKTGTISIVSPNPTILPCKWKGCTQVFHQADLLYLHLCQDHIGRKCQKNLQLNCQWDNCQTKTEKRDHITSHLRVHIPLKPFNCSNCNKKFKRPQDLKKHLKIHITGNDLIKKKRGPKIGSKKKSRSIATHSTTTLPDTQNPIYTPQLSSTIRSLLPIQHSSSPTLLNNNQSVSPIPTPYSNLNTLNYFNKLSQNMSIQNLQLQNNLQYQPPPPQQQQVPYNFPMQHSNSNSTTNSPPMHIIDHSNLINPYPTVNTLHNSTRTPTPPTATTTQLPPLFNNNTQTATNTTNNKHFLTTAILPPPTNSLLTPRYNIQQPYSYTSPTVIQPTTTQYFSTTQKSGLNTKTQTPDLIDQQIKSLSLSDDEDEDAIDEHKEDDNDDDETMTFLQDFTYVNVIKDYIFCSLLEEEYQDLQEEAQFPRAKNSSTIKISLPSYPKVLI
ncbi:hypothetical protein TBLA_0A08460 [Henningerozyma blattae CBS 6284]|uniref:C2H2-type domain-containing protein n=1 Tax=Henningerozyma blattae (strain ATCC 34711 / CBS 6284 / DSM 70876 / NBRC 10599 / NRRL Y-10934 / UCD 77-7) TaxID=1071380 RepID=I2GWY3_HENB6|nr:hypothetical protein TBLA_0A08460 [Tetrapisispora blattae CBS 6284]CCH58635.1 hypothetical protein TBLA_0A08460 [Tetrapisispora blattae CBS 6284]